MDFAKKKSSQNRRFTAKSPGAGGRTTGAPPSSIPMYEKGRHSGP
jgi:hypothetical protein